MQRECSRKVTSTPHLMASAITCPSWGIDTEHSPTKLKPHSGWFVVVFVFLFQDPSQDFPFLCQGSWGSYWCESFGCPLQIWEFLAFSTLDSRRDLCDIMISPGLFTWGESHGKVPLAWSVTITDIPEISTLGSEVWKEVHHTQGTVKEGVYVLPSGRSAPPETAQDAWAREYMLTHFSQLFLSPRSSRFLLYTWDFMKVFIMGTHWLPFACRSSPLSWWHLPPQDHIPGRQTGVWEHPLWKLLFSYTVTLSSGMPLATSWSWIHGIAFVLT